MFCCAKPIDGKRVFEEISVGTGGIEFGPTTKIQKRAGDGCVVHSVNGTDVLEVCDTDVTANVPVVLPNGSQAVPSLTGAEADTGVFFDTGKTLVGVGGAEVLDIGAAEISTPVNLKTTASVEANNLVTNNGDAATPAIRGTDSNIGTYYVPTIGVGVTVNGAPHTFFQANRLDSEGSLYVDDGVKNVTDETTGYNMTATNLTMDVAGTTHATVSSTGVEVNNGVVELPDGTFANPALTFSSDNAVGVWNNGGDLGFKVGSQDCLCVQDTDQDFVIEIFPRARDSTTRQEIRAIGQNGVNRDIISWEAWNGGGGVHDMYELDFKVNSGTDAAPVTTNTFSVTQNGCQVVDGSVTNPAMGFKNETNSGVYRVGAGEVGLAVTGTKIMGIKDAQTTFTNPVVQPYASAAGDNGGVTIPDDTVVFELANGGSVPFALTGPTAVAGQMLYVYNDSGQNTTGLVTTNGAGATFAYNGSTWLAIA
jgi:hypothetical protein